MSVSAFVDTLRCHHRTAIAATGDRESGCALLNDHLGGDVQRSLHERGLDEGAGACCLTEGECNESGEAGMQAAERVTRCPRHGGRAIDEAGDCGKTAELLHRLREATPLTPRTVEPEGRHS